MMAAKSNSCEICYRPTTLFNYGVQSCNACKMFFRRVVTLKTSLIDCENNDGCFKNPEAIQNYNCRLCRFQQCLRTQMIHNHDNIQFFNLLPILTHMETEKWNLFVNFKVAEHITFEEVTDSSPILFTPKSPNTQNTYFDWEFINHVVTIDFIKKLDFVRLLTTSDSKAFLKNSYLNVCIFALAVKLYFNSLEYITYPEGCPVFPKEIEVITSKCPKIENNIKCRMIGKLRDLRITQEEFMLLNVIFICNPDVPCMSETGRLLLHCYQQMYSSLLLKYCQFTYQKNAPTRFTELLSICHVISRTKQDITNVAILFQVYQPGMEWNEMLKEAIQFHLG